MTLDTLLPPICLSETDCSELGRPHPPQLLHDAIVAVRLDHVVEVEVSNTDLLSEAVSSNAEMSSIGRSQALLVLLRPKKVDGMYGTVLLRELEKMACKSRLRSLWSRDLDSLTECLQPLLFPEHLRLR